MKTKKTKRNPHWYIPADAMPDPFVGLLGEPILGPLNLDMLRHADSRVQGSHPTTHGAQKFPLYLSTQERAALHMMAEERGMTPSPWLRLVIQALWRRREELRKSRDYWAGICCVLDDNQSYCHLKKGHSSHHEDIHGEWRLGEVLYRGGYPAADIYPLLFDYESDHGPDQDEGDEF